VTDAPAAGPAVGGVLLLLGSPALAFLSNAATFGLSAIAVLAIPGGEAFRPARSRTGPTGCSPRAERPSRCSRVERDGAECEAAMHPVVRAGQVVGLAGGRLVDGQHRHLAFEALLPGPRGQGRGGAQVLGA
jgi:hypothetical protein